MAARPVRANSTRKKGAHGPSVVDALPACGPGLRAALQLERHHFLALLAQAFDTEGHHVEKHFLDFEEPYRLQR